MLSCTSITAAREIAEVASNQLLSQVYALYCRGESYYDISVRLDLPYPHVARVMCERFVKEQHADPKKLKRQKEEARLDFLWKQAATHADSGALSWIDSCLKISERKSKLLGLDAPVKQEVAVSQTPINLAALSDEEVMQLHNLLNKAGQTLHQEDGDGE